MAVWPLCLATVYVPRWVLVHCGAPDVASGKRVCRLPAGTTGAEPPPPAFLFAGGGNNGAQSSPLRSVNSNTGGAKKSAFGTQFINGSNHNLHQQQHSFPPQQTSIASARSGSENIENLGQPLSFELGGRLGDLQPVRWNALLRGKNLYLQVPTQQLLNVSKEAFVNLLEYAEEQLHCQNVIIKLDKSRCEKTNTLMRMFMYFGFEMLSPTHPLIPKDAADSGLFMAYNIQ